MSIEFEDVALPEGSEDTQGAVESTTEASEQQRKRATAAAGAYKKQQKKEKQAKKRDYSLASLLSYFLQHADSVLHKQLLATALVLVEDDVEPAFILSVLSLLFPEMEGLLSADEERRQELLQNETRLFMRREIVLVTNDVKQFNAHALPEELQRSIKQWIKTMQLALAQSDKEANSKLLVAGGFHKVALKLVSFVLEEFLNQNKIQGEYQEVESFAQSVVGVVLKGGIRDSK